MSTAARSRSPRSVRRTRPRCHSESTAGSTTASDRTVATRNTRSASTSWPTSVADVVSSRWRSSTNSTSVPPAPSSRSTGRSSDTIVTRSQRSSAMLAGRRWARAPSGIDRAPSVAVARATLRPARSASARHWSASRVLPTPAVPWMTNPWARGSARAAVNSSSSSLRPTSGHCNGSGVPVPAAEPVPPTLSNGTGVAVRARPAGRHGRGPCGPTLLA